MNILFITDEDLLKSIVYDVHILAEGLSLLGHKIYVVDWESEGGHWYRIAENKMARVYPHARVDMARFGFVKIHFLGALVGNFTSYRAIRKVIKERNIELIVLYSVLCSGIPAVILGKQFKIPIVFRNIDMLHRLMPTKIKQKVVKYLERKVYPKADTLLSLTPKYTEYLVNLGADRSKVKQLLFPVDTELFRSDIDFTEVRQKWNIDEKEKVIVFAGYLYNFSGLADFIYQFPEVVRQVPTAKLVLVGDGPMRPKLERIILELDLMKHIIITGLQPFCTMPQYINMASICINAYPVSGEMKDLFSAKIIQYLACGKATVSSSLPGITTLLTGESCGVVFTDSAADMAREVILLLKSCERREQLGRAGSDYVKKEHSRKKVISQLEVYLKETIEINQNDRKKGYKKYVKNQRLLKIIRMKNKSMNTGQKNGENQ